MVSRRTRSTVRRIVVSRDKTLRAELRDEMQRAANALEVLHQQSVSSWSFDVRWIKQVSVTRNLIAALVRPDARTKAGKIYTWVDKGTGLHGPRRQAYKIPKFVSASSKLLKFRTNYQPNTKPIAKANVGPGVATGGWVTAQQVTHPGIEARKFSETFIERLNPSLKRRIDNAIRRAIRRRG